MKKGSAAYSNKIEELLDVLHADVWSSKEIVQMDLSDVKNQYGSEISDALTLELNILRRSQVTNPLKGLAIFFNGPPSSGKDFASEKLIEYLDGTDKGMHNEFKDMIFQLVILATGITRERFFELYNNRETKEVQTPELWGYSPRGIMIAMSEKGMKPVFGDKYFGERAARGIDANVGAVFSDSGFAEELYPIAEKLGPSNMFIVRVHRLDDNGNPLTYEGDSRTYLDPESCPEGVNFIDLDNNGSIYDLVSSVWNWVRSIKHTDDDYLTGTFHKL